MPGELIPIILGIGAFVMIIFIRKYINQERMSMIEKGVGPNDLPNTRSYIGIQLGFLFLGAGVGLLIGYFLDRAFRMDEVAYFSMIFIFGGIGLIASHMYIKKQEGDS